MKRLTVLGSGNAFHSDGRGHASFLLESSSGEALLLDVGATALYKARSLQVDLENVDVVLITHFHGDHFGGLPFLLLDWDLISGRKRPLTIAGPLGLTERCEALHELLYPGYSFGFPLDYVPLYRATQIGSFHIECFAVRHRPESLAYRITGPLGRSIAFSGDAAFGPELQALYRGVDLGLLEVSLEEQVDPPIKHVALEELLQADWRPQARRMLYTHTTDALARKLDNLWPGSAAYDGQVLELE